MNEIEEEIKSLYIQGKLEIPNEWFHYHRGLGRYGSWWNGEYYLKIWPRSTMAVQHFSKL